jgi:hypothetical protein
MAAVGNLQFSPINHLQKLMDRQDDCSFPAMVKVIEAARDTIGISADNYLAWQQRFLGSTGYIDGISADELGDKHLVWGYDPHDRLFITFQYQIITTDENENKTTERESATLFQRYSNRFGPAAQGGPKKYFICLESSKDIKELHTLFSGNTIVKSAKVRQNDKLLSFTKEISLTNTETRALPTTDYRFIKIS